MIFELVAGLVVVVLLVVLIGFAVDKLTVGGDGIWYGPGEPPEGFIGFWDRGDTVVQWPTPAGEVFDNYITVQSVTTGAITADMIVEGSITADTITTTEIIPDPDRPGFLTTKQELARRRQQ